MRPIVGRIEEKIICSVDFIHIELFTRIFKINILFLKYVMGPDWNYSLLRI